MSRKFGPQSDICCQPNFQPNGAYDARISFKSSRPDLLLEFTQAKDGKDQYLRMRFLNAYGHVNLFGPIYKDAEDLAKNAVAVEGSKRRLQQIERIIECLQKKSAKCYPDNCLLVIVFDDTGFNESEIQNLQLEIRAGFRETQSSFVGIHLLGVPNETLLEVQPSGSVLTLG